MAQDAHEYCHVHTYLIERNLACEISLGKAFFHPHKLEKLKILSKLFDPNTGTTSVRHDSSNSFSNEFVDSLQY